MLNGRNATFGVQPSSVRSRFVYLHIIVLLFMCIAGSLSQLQPAHAQGERTVQLGFFYNQPTDGTSAEKLANAARFIVFDEGSASFRDQMRAAGYQGKILQYLLSNEVEGPGPYLNAAASCNAAYAPLRNQVADRVGDFCRYVHPNESWFLHNSKGERLYGTSNGKLTYRMNPASAGWHSFAQKRMLADLIGDSEQPAHGFDGIFLDNVYLNWGLLRTSLPTSDGGIKEFSTNDAFRAAWVGYLQTLSDGLRNHGPVWGNMVADLNDGASWNAYLKHLDGGMFETFATGYSTMTVEQWSNNMVQAEAAIMAGKGVLMVSNGAKDDLAKQRFTLASHLLVANGKNTFFRYVSNAHGHEYRSLWLYPNYSLALGVPKEMRVPIGKIWRRYFDCGYVTVDPAARSAQIVQTECGLPTPPRPTPVTVIQPNASIGVDTRVERQNPTTNFGAAIALSATGKDSLSPSHFIVRFDLSSIPATDSCLSAKLSFWTSSTTSVTADYQVFKAVANDDWQENGATWNAKKSGSTWAGGTNGGGVITTDIQNNVLGVFRYRGKAPVDTEVATAVTCAALQPHFGSSIDLVVKRLGTVKSAVPTFRSSESASPNRPRLAITHDAPNDGTSPASPTATVPIATATPEPTAVPSATPVPTAARVAQPVQFSNLTDGQSVTGTIKSQALVTTGKSVTSAIFYIDGRSIWREGQAPYFLGGDTQGVANGYDTRNWSNSTHILKAVVTHSDGSTAVNYRIELSTIPV